MEKYNSKHYFYSSSDIADDHHDYQDHSGMTSCPMDDQDYGYLSHKSNQIFQEFELNQSQNQKICSNVQESINSKPRGVCRNKTPLELTQKQQMLLGRKVISGLQKNIVSLPFREPIDPSRLNIPDYFEIIEQPMDLRTIKNKLSSDLYISLEQIYSDIELIIKNGQRYNELNTDVLRLVNNFQKCYNKIKRNSERIMRKILKAENKLNQKKIKQESCCESVETTQSLRNIEPEPLFEHHELVQIARRIRKLDSTVQIELFKKVGIHDTYTIDIKELQSSQIKTLLNQLQGLDFEKENALIREAQSEGNKVACQ